MASSRFPGKPMVPILGIPMIGHCFFRTRMSSLLESVYVATCDQVIFEYVNGLGGQAVMTGDHHERATDRTAEALKIIESQSGAQVEVVVMVQGDEPMVIPKMIDSLVEPFLTDPELMVTNLMAPISSYEDFEDPGVVKVVVDPHQYALYFSREPIPSRKKAGKEPVSMLKQTGLMAFRRSYLASFGGLGQTPLEKIESVDMMRVLETGGRIRMVMSSSDLLSVDTEADLNRVEAVIARDPLVKTYS
jgi:3-deoxy-manno-octulosonate cytidylyltransferase (CMP-KDO synthetase)